VTFRLERPQPGTDWVIWGQRIAEQIESALGASQEYMGDVPTVTIATDYTGAISPAAQLPKAIPVQRFNGSVDVSDKCTWTADLLSGDATFTIDTHSGVLTLTGVSVDSVINVRSLRKIGRTNQTLAKPVGIKVSAATAPTGTGGGSTGTVSTFFDFSSTTPISVATVTAVAGASGQIQLSAPSLSVTTDAFAPVGLIPVHLVWKDGGGNLGSGTDSSPTCQVRLQSGQYVVTDGAVTAVYNKTGLTPGNTYSFDLMASLLSGSRTMYLYGTANAVGS
jgi:hypothetical protein